jgi:hypothetical protein
MRILRLANFVMPRSGGLRTALRSTDLVPYLVRTAAKEWWSEMRSGDSADSFWAFEWVVGSPEGAHGERARCPAVEDAETARS